jgi:hypothetical protein
MHAHGADQGAAAKALGRCLAKAGQLRAAHPRAFAPDGPQGVRPPGGAGGSAACRPPTPIGVRPRLITSRMHSCVLPDGRGSIAGSL